MIEVEYTHEVDAATRTDKVKMERVVESGKAYTDEAFKLTLAERLEREFKAVNPVVVRYEFLKPPTAL